MYPDKWSYWKVLYRINLFIIVNISHQLLTLRGIFYIFRATREVKEIKEVREVREVNEDKIVMASKETLYPHFVFCIHVGDSVSCIPIFNTLEVYVHIFVLTYIITETVHKYIYVYVQCTYSIYSFLLI